MPNIEPLEIDELPAELSAIADNYQKTMGEVPASFRTMARKPLIAKAYGDLQKAIAQSITYPAELRSMMFLMQSQASGCLYCQAHSVSALARSNNVSEEKIKDLWAFETSAVFSDAERAALRFTLAVASRPNAASEVEFAGLREHYNEEQIVEMVAALSVGAFLNTWNDTAATQLDSKSVETASANLGERGWTAGKHG